MLRPVLAMKACQYCTYSVPTGLDRCPHCARPSLFPNVDQVEETAEIAAVERRYQRALDDTAARGCSAVAGDFEAKAAAAQAVIARPIEEALRLAKGDDQGYATFYQLLHAGVRFPTGSRWDRLRGLADVELFGTYRDHVRFAALALDGAWLPHYGPVALELKEPMIAHRATVFEENSAVFFKRRRAQGEEPPVVAGFRARWCDRGKLALAKHAHDLSQASNAADFSSTLLRPGATGTGEDDVFIEVHIYGSMTRNCLSRVIIDKQSVDPALAAKLREVLGDKAQER